MKPRHKGPVKVELYRWDSARKTWKLKATKRVTATSTGAWRWKGSVAAGTWKARAIHSDTRHATTTSGFSAKVKVE